MYKITLSGQDKVKEALRKWEQIEVIVYGWMKGGKPDQIMQKSFAMNFAREGREEKWSELSEETIRSRDYLGYDERPILQRSGELMESITSMFGKVTTASKEVQMTWGLEQLPEHVRKKFGPNQIGKGKAGQDLPARPMIGFQEQDGTSLSRSLRDWILMEMQ